MGRTVIVLTLGILALSTASILIKVCDDVPAISIAAWRMSIAAVCMLGLAKARGVQFRAIDRKAWAGILLGSVFLAAHFSFWVTSLKFTSVASSVVLVTTNPIFVALFSWLLLKEKHSYELIVGTLLSFMGSVVLTLGDAGTGISLSGGEKAVWGDVLALLGAVMASGYLMVGSRMRERVDLFAYASLLYSFCAVWLTVLTLALGLKFTGFKTSSWWALIGTAIIPQVIGHTTINWALKHLRTTLVAITILGEPIGATLLAYLILGEQIGRWQGIGMAMILIAILIASRRGRKEGVPVGNP